MREVAREMNVVTQMGNQGHAFDGARRIVELIRDGAIGQVREVHCWTDRPNGHWWKQPVAVPSERPPVPAGLDWDLWLGPAPKRAYHRIYCPHDWRAWWDLALSPSATWPATSSIRPIGRRARPPPSVWRPSRTAATTESAPAWQIIKFQFPERTSPSRGVTLPPVSLTWYDGGKNRPRNWPKATCCPREERSGSAARGRSSPSTTTASFTGCCPKRNLKATKAPNPTCRNPRSEYAPYMEWIAACKGLGTTFSNFDYASRLTESMLVGVLAVRLGKKIEWEARIRSPKTPRKPRR